MADQVGPPKDEILELYDDLQSRFATRNAEYQLARMRYRGEHWDAETNPAPRNRYSLTVNYLKPFCDKSIQLLVGRLPGIQVLPPGVDEQSRRLAEKLEGVLYGTWYANDIAEMLYKVAWNTVVLGQGIVYTWWDYRKNMVTLQSVAPENWFPVLDGEKVREVIHVSRRDTRQLKREYKHDNIEEDSGMFYPRAVSDPSSRSDLTGYTTVLDYFNEDGEWVRIMGDVVKRAKTLYPFGLPFVRFINDVEGDEQEPTGEVGQLVELNQYLDQLISQRADVIRKYANPTIIDRGSGQDPARVQSTISADGAVLPIRKDGEIYLLNWQGTSPDIDAQIEKVLDSMFDISGKPRSAFGQTVTNQSGVVTNLMLTPTLQSNEMHETLWGAALVRMNEHILQLWETFSGGEVINFRGVKPSGALLRGLSPFEVQMYGSEIAGWYKNRVKWPSAIRTDDPVYVQMIQSRVTGNPPTLSVYDALEMYGVEDCEAMLDRITMQLQDPRLHPERLEAAIGVANSLQQAATQDPALIPSESYMPELDPYQDMPGDEAMLAGAGSPASAQAQALGGPALF